MYYIIIALIITIFFILLAVYLIYSYSYFTFPYLDYETTLCKYKRFGCCKDNLTPKYDPDGTNCRGF